MKRPLSEKLLASMRVKEVHHAESTDCHSAARRAAHESRIAPSTSEPRENNYLALQWITAISVEMALFALALIYFPFVTASIIVVSVASYSLYQFFTTPKPSDTHHEADNQLSRSDYGI
jgi:hypothetical protein